MKQIYEFELRFHARNEEEILSLTWTIYSIISYRHMRNSGAFNGNRTHDLCKVMYKLSFNNYTFQRKQKSPDFGTKLFHTYVCHKHLSPPRGTLILVGATCVQSERKPCINNIRVSVSVRVIYIYIYFFFFFFC